MEWVPAKICQKWQQMSTKEFSSVKHHKDIKGIIGELFDAGNDNEYSTGVFCSLKFSHFEERCDGKEFEWNGFMEKECFVEANTEKQFMELWYS